MKLRKYILCIAIGTLVATAFTGCKKADDTNKEKKDSADYELSEEGEIGLFRPVDCGIQSQEVYEYPFIGLTVELSEKMLHNLDSRDVFLYTQEDYSGADVISYAAMYFAAPTQEQKEEEGMSVDIFAWEEALEKVGVIGVYQKDMAAQLDDLTGCDTHQKIGTSEDGTYEYYFSTNSNGNQEYAEELEKAKITISEMHDLDGSLGYSAFSEDRIDGIENVGSFTIQDVNGETYTEDLFQDYDLTLVNIFATWCSPCVQEMPELEELRKEYEEKDVKLGVVAVVLDAKTAKGTDEDAVKLAQTLAKKSGAQFPFLIPDEGNMNGRLTGIESVPESFFVDSNGNIVSEPYVGANSKEGWSEIVENELAKLR